MEIIMNYWYVILGIVAVLAAVGVAIYKFAGLPTKEQLEKIKEWLLFAVTKAESELGGGTGKLKLRTVYDMFIAKFPMTAKFISFESFSTLVDDALEEMRKMLETNQNIKRLVNNDNT